MANKAFRTASGLACALVMQGASAADWGCEVLLCLANPAGPMAAAACVPPITRLYQSLFKPKPDPFPQCAMAGGGGGSYAYIAPPSFYDPCPKGLQALPVGFYAARGQFVQRTTYSPFSAGYEVVGSVFFGMGETSEPIESNQAGQTFLPNKICVAKKLGQAVHYPAATLDNLAPDPLLVDIFETVLSVAPAKSSFNINVVINGQLARNVRP
jgi:hypothetical protein